MAQVLFITQDSAYPQMGVLYLIDALARQGIDAEMLASGVTFEHLEAVLAYVRPQIVGMSVLTAPQTQDFVRLSVYLKENHPEIKIVWGGNHATLLPNICLKSWYIDYVFVGQGETLFPKMVKDLLSDEEKVPRLVHGYGTAQLDDYQPAWEKDDLAKYLFSERHSVRNPDIRVKQVFSQSVSQIDRMIHATQSADASATHLQEFSPKIELAIEEMKKWDVGLYQTDKKLFYYLLTSRGCPFNCSFCSEPLHAMHGDENGKFLWNAHGFEWFRRQVDRIRMLLAAKNLKMDGIGLWDDMFWTNYRDDTRCFDILNYLQSQGLGYLIEARADHLLRDDAMIMRRLTETGCIQVFIGAESFSQTTLNLIRKGTKVADYQKLCRMANDFQVSLRMSFIVGFPGETDESVNTTLDFCESVENGDHGAWVNISGPKLFTPYPGTEEFDRAVKAGFVPPATHEEWGRINRMTVNYLAHYPWMERNYSLKTVKRLERHFGKG